MDRRFRDLLPGSAAIENLESLLLEALAVPAFLDEQEDTRAGRNWNGPNWVAAERRLKEFEARIRERGEYVGAVAVARILREPIPPREIWNTANIPRLVLNPARNWISGVISNIQFELDGIERRQMLFVTAAATVIALFAATVAVVTAVIELTK